MGDIAIIRHKYTIATEDRRDRQGAGSIALPYAFFFDGLKSNCRKILLDNRQYPLELRNLL